MNNQSTHLNLNTWTEIRDYLKRSKTIILPIGSTEQHGPTGAIGTDALTAEAISMRVGEMTNTIVAPVVSYGMAEHHLGFPGTMSLKPSTFQLVLHDLIFSLALNGFQKIFVINGHGGNIASAKAAFSEVYKTIENNRINFEGNFKCKLLNWFMLQEIYQLSRELYGDNEGQHATPSEIAITMHLEPELVAKNKELPPPSPAGPIYDKNDFMRRYPDGRMGSVPYLAKSEHGALLLEKSSKILSDLLFSFIKEQ